MKKITIGMFALAMMFVAGPVFASNSYAPTDNKCIDGDLAVYNNITYFIDSCLPKVDVDAAKAESIKYSSSYTGEIIVVKRGQKLLTTFGFVDTCPVWFPMDCVIDPELFVEWR